MHFSFAIDSFILHQTSSFIIDNFVFNSIAYSDFWVHNKINSGKLEDYFILYQILVIIEILVQFKGLICDL
jgi:hypothetical protein